MINLLPPQDKQELKREVIFRKVFAILFLHFICVLILVGVLGFLSAFLSSKAVSFQEIAIQKAQQLQSARFQAFKNDAVSLNGTLNKLQAFWQGQIMASSFLERFVPLISSNLYLTDLSFNLSSKKVPIVRNVSTAPGDAVPSDSAQLIFADIHLDGTADSRETLYEFKKVLERQSDFSDIYFSPYSWSNAQYPGFSLNLSFIPANK